MHPINWFTLLSPLILLPFCLPPPLLTSLPPLSFPNVPQEKAQGRNAHYKLTSTVMLWLQTIKAGSGTMNLGGSLTRQTEQDFAVNDASPHIANIGRMVEVRGHSADISLAIVVLTTASILFSLIHYHTAHLQDMENKIRQTLNEIYFGKTKDIVNDLRYNVTIAKFLFSIPSIFCFRSVFSSLHRSIPSSTLSLSLLPSVFSFPFFHPSHSPPSSTPSLPFPPQVGR